MPFEEFQRRLDTALAGLPGVVPIFDDVLIYGVGETKAEAIENHDQRLIALLDRCKSKGVNLNKKKCKFRLSEVSFMSHVISEEGLKPDPVMSNIHKLIQIENSPFRSVLFVGSC